MPVTVEQLTAKLTENLQPLSLNIVDQSGGCGAKFFIIVTSQAFEGMALLERQRLVHEIIQDEMKEIHALQLKTWTPEQYDARKEKIPELLKA